MDLTITLCGDIMLATEVDRLMGNTTAREWLAGVSSAWEGSDIVIGNLESPCVSEAQPVNGPMPELVFRAPARRLGELAEAGFSALTLANNHILNCGPTGLCETRQGLDQVGIYHAGAGMNLEEALQPAFIPVRNVTCALVAFCYGPPAGRSHAGVAPCEPKWMRKALKLARANADLVIAALHDGLEYSDVPPSQTRARFRFLAENGADIVFGHHPHVLQGLEWQGAVPIAYSLGDLLSHNSLPEVAKRNFSRMAMGYLAPEEVKRNNSKFSRGAILTIRVSDDKKSITWHPFRQNGRLKPQLSFGSAKTDDLQRLDALSELLLKHDGPLHGLADRIVNELETRGLDKLGVNDLLKLARRPKWRYIPSGIKLLWRRMTKPRTNRSQSAEDPLSHCRNQ